MRASALFAPVVPRGIAPVSGESIPLAEIVANHFDGNIRTIRITGCGKTTALSHLAAEFSDNNTVEILDEEAPSPPTNHGLTVFACDEADPKADLTVKLSKWTVDEVIEYVMAQEPSRCKSVMTRLAKSNDVWLGNGAPEVLTPVLDLMIEDDQPQTFEDALAQYFRSLHLPEDIQRRIQFSFLRIMLREEYTPYILGQLQHSVDESVVKLFHHAPVRFALSKGPLIRSLEARDGTKLLELPLPKEFINLVANSIKNSPGIHSYLSDLANNPASNKSANAASLIAANDKEWRPTPEENHRFDYSYLQDMNWECVSVKKASMTSADFSNSRLSRANLMQTKVMQANFYNADLRGANFESADASQAVFLQANLRMIQAKNASFEMANLCNVDASHSDFVSANLDTANLKGANFSKANLESATLDDADLTDVNFADAILTNANLERVDFRRVAFEGAVLKNAILSQCNFADTKIRNTIFDGAILESAILTASTLHKVSMQNCDFHNAKMADVNWEGCDLRKSSFDNVQFHMGSTRSGLVGSVYPSHGTRTGFYTEDFDEQHFKSPEEIRKASLRGCDLRGAIVTRCDFYLVDLRDAIYNDEQRHHFERCNAILTDVSNCD